MEVASGASRCYEPKLNPTQSGRPVIGVETRLLAGRTTPRWTTLDHGGILPAMMLSARNKLVGRIEEIQFGGVMAHVVIRVGNDLIESVITKRSADEMELKVGDTVKAVIKSTEVMLEKD
jgi:molybdopterin-binding protein